MVQVYFSHTGKAPLFGVRRSETVSPGTVRHIFYELATRYPSLLDEVLDKSATKLNRLYSGCDILRKYHNRERANGDEICRDKPEGHEIPGFHKSYCRRV